MENRRIRLKKALEEKGVSQEKVAEKLGVKSQAVSARLNDTKRDIDSIDFIEAVAELTGRSSEWFIHGIERDEIEEMDQAYYKHRSQMEKFHSFNETIEPYATGSNLRTIAVTVDKSGRELMSFVPVRAQAGYMKGYGDPHFIETLPAFSLPTFTEGSYRMFQVDGSSMLQMGGGGLHDGDIVIAQYLEDFFTIRDNRVYVVVCDEGVVVKRCLNRLKSDDQVLILKSDNKSGDYPDMVLHASEIREVWELKAFLSRQLSFATDLWEVISELQAQQALLTQKLNKLDNEKKTIRRAR